MPAQNKQVLTIVGAVVGVLVLVLLVFGILLLAGAISFGPGKSEEKSTTSSPEPSATAEPPAPTQPTPTNGTITTKTATANGAERAGTASGTSPNPSGANTVTSQEEDDNCNCCPRTIICQFLQLNGGNGAKGPYYMSTSQPSYTVAPTLPPSSAWLSSNAMLGDLSVEVNSTNPYLSMGNTMTIDGGKSKVYYHNQQIIVKQPIYVLSYNINSPSASLRDEVSSKSVTFQSAQEVDMTSGRSTLIARKETRQNKKIAKVICLNSGDVIGKASIEDLYEGTIGIYGFSYNRSSSILSLLLDEHYVGGVDVLAQNLIAPSGHVYNVNDEPKNFRANFSRIFEDQWRGKGSDNVKFSNQLADIEYGDLCLQVNEIRRSVNMSHCNYPESFSAEWSYNITNTHMVGNCQPVHGRFRAESNDWQPIRLLVWDGRLHAEIQESFDFIAGYNVFDTYYLRFGSYIDRTQLDTSKTLLVFPVSHRR